ncbi:calaxin [Bacillus rossius redtenbacheri]|uniref:calaxin n=1 Tax=Bacillus rossius redtenbacheri TaxID=93214 RepID=UPI002FDCFC5D
MAMKKGSLTVFLASGWKASLRSAAGGRDMAEEVAKAGKAGKCSLKLLESLRKRTHFTRQEIEALCRMYQKLVSSNTLIFSGGQCCVPPLSGISMSPAATVCEGLDRVVFRELLHNTFDLVTEEVLMDRIFCAFDRCNVGTIRLEEWVCGLSVFLRGTFEERTAFCFLVYDLNNDGYISKDEMFHLLRNCLVKQPQDEDPDEGVKDLVEMALRKLDSDHDGKVSFKDYQKAVKDEPLLLEAFGQCLPAETPCQTFISTLNS